MESKVILSKNKTKGGSVRVMKLALVMALTFGLIFSMVPRVSADETSDIILRLLVKKGVISQREVNEIKSEIRAQEKRIPDVGEIKDHVKKASWADRIKVKGDLRLRHETGNTGATPKTVRQRFRARIGLEAKILDNLKAGIAMASGGTSATSTNQSFQDAFQTKAWGLDMAYLRWTPYDFIKIEGGKYKNPLYRPGDLLWDSDLRFEGFSTNLKYNLSEDFDYDLDLMLNTGLFILDNFSSDINNVDKKNPYLYVIQGGVGSSYEDIVDWKIFVGYLDFLHLSSGPSNFAPNVGSADAAGYYLYDFNVIELSGDATFHYLEQNMPEWFAVPVTVFFDYANNTEGWKRTAWEIGVKLGKKPKAFGDWRTVYNFRSLEKNAWPDEFPDADAFRGRPDGYGHEVIFSYGLAKNVWLEFDYYGFRDRTRGTEPNDKWGHLFQADINVKF